MPKLTDTQLAILSAAAQREDGAALPLPRPLKIKGAAVTKMLEGLYDKGMLEERPASRGAAAWREQKDGRRMMLVISDAGLHAIDDAPTEEPRKKQAATKVRANKPRADQKTAASEPQRNKSAPAAVRPGTKQALLIDLLKRETGANIGEIVEATGWQAHYADVRIMPR